ncbi:hypothetical protein [Asticcacaulis solisilvae]|uniref:hypothetical protein n=1 Tax=Asticcacaulis solisilvae TaxID=1217274 RepID=UPI003FD8CD43
MTPRLLGGFVRLPALVLFAGLTLAGCASSPKYDTADGAAKPAAADGRSQVVHSSADPDNDWGDAVTAPLQDLNLKRVRIPQILLDAMQRPYDLNGLDRCDAISDEVRKLDTVLGADLDEPPPPPDKSTMGQKGGRMANNAAVGAVRGATRSVIPFRGLVRQMTGAEQHDKEVNAAIQAGKVRRAYLKGVGMNKNCAPPAAPAWFKPKPVDDTDDGSTGKKRKTSRKHP